MKRRGIDIDDRFVLMQQPDILGREERFELRQKGGRNKKVRVAAQTQLRHGIQRLQHRALEQCVRDAGGGKLFAPPFERRLRLGKLKDRAIKKRGELHLPLMGERSVVLQQKAAHTHHSLRVCYLQQAVKIDVFRQRGCRRSLQKRAQKRQQILLFRADTP